jgi:hypothetical protein
MFVILRYMLKRGNRNERPLTEDENIQFSAPRRKHTIPVCAELLDGSLGAQGHALFIDMPTTAELAADPDFATARSIVLGCCGQ